MPAQSWRAGATMAPARRAPLVALLGADGISLGGNALAQLAIPWFVLTTTGSAARTGLVAFCGLLPTILAAFFGGAVVDRLGHRRASVAADVASMVAVALIPLAYSRGLLPFWLLLALVFLGALLDAPGATARAALWPDVARLGGVRLERANTLHEFVESGAGSLGPLLAGGLIAWLGATTVLWLDAATFAVSALLVAALVPAPQAAPTAPPAREDERAALAAGLHFLWRDGPIRAIYGASIVFTFLLVSLFAVILPYFFKTAGAGAAGLGLVVAAFSAGQIAGAAVYGAAGHRWPRRGTFLVGVAAIGGALVALAFLPPVSVMVGALLVGGVIAGPNGPLIATILQERTPADLRGRVFGATTAVSFAAAPLGVLLAGALLPTIGVRATLAGSAALFLAVVAALARDDGLRELAIDGG
ncbi:MAG TPA: MFS transporter [Thermomicrobiales bacterium]|nr:MFS transporter [Thermomicrobiales bacterium]